jgi:hemerythrin-like domain-containing protein
MARHAELVDQDAKSFARQAEELCLAYSRHMRREEESLFPMAEQLAEGSDGLFSWEEGLTQTMHQEHGELLRHLEHAAEAWPIEDVRWH